MPNTRILFFDIIYKIKNRAAQKAAQNTSYGRSCMMFLSIYGNIT